MAFVDKKVLWYIFVNQGTSKMSNRLIFWLICQWKQIYSLAVSYVYTSIASIKLTTVTKKKFIQLWKMSKWQLPTMYDTLEATVLNRTQNWRRFLTFALRILSAHSLWRHFARARARAYWAHGEFALILSSVSLKMAKAHQRAWAPNHFFSHCNELITIFAWEKAYLISIAESRINKETTSRNLVQILIKTFCPISVWIKLKNVYL